MELGNKLKGLIMEALSRFFWNNSLGQHAQLSYKQAVSLKGNNIPRINNNSINTESANLAQHQRGGDCNAAHSGQRNSKVAHFNLGFPHMVE